MKGQWGKLVGYFLATLLVSSAVTFGLPLLGGGSWLPDLISSEGSAIDKLFWGLMIVSLVIFAIVAAVVIYSVLHFRAEPGDLSDGEHIHGNAKMEVAWIVIPSIIVFVIGVLSYMVLEDNEVGLYDKAASKKPGAAEMAVDVRGFSFGWNFRYEDKEGNALGGDDATPSTELVLPVDQVVRFNVMSCSGKEHLGRIRREVGRELDAGGEESEFGEIKPGICEREWDATTEEDQKAAEEEQTQIHAMQEKREDGKDLSKEEQALYEGLPRFQGDDQF
ncbi:MAG: coxB, partial [Thermoleophilia bacterium]|nr:coxB [Thermoleophilia bacterium]